MLIIAQIVFHIHVGVAADRRLGKFKGMLRQIFCTPLFFYKQSIFDPRPENCLSFSKKLPQKIV